MRGKPVRRGTAWAMPTALVALFLAVTTSSAAGVIRRPGLSDGRTASAISSTALSAMPVTRLPAGVSLHPIDGGAHYFAKWHNGFPGSTRFIPIGVYPSEG